MRTVSMLTVVSIELAAHVNHISHVPPLGVFRYTQPIVARQLLVRKRHKIHINIAYFKTDKYPEE